MRRHRLYAACLLPLLLGGCVGVPSADTADGEADPWAGAMRQTLVALDAPAHEEADVACVFGGVAPLDRAGGRVLDGSGTLEFAVRVDGTYTGLQVGYAIDDGPVTWLDTVAGGSEHTFVVDVPPGTEELPRGAHRWSFHYQLNVPNAEQECYTGAGSGAYGILIEAVRGSA